MEENTKVGFIGGGAIAEALIRGTINAGLFTPGQITVYDIAEVRLEYLHTTYAINVVHSVPDLLQHTSMLFLTVKPQVIPSVVSDLADTLPAGVLVVTVAAGVPLAVLEDKLVGVPVVRVMPNTPVAVGAGMAAIALGQHASKQMGDQVAAVFNAVGQAVILPESSMDAVTGLSGSGPAYGFIIIDALADAGVRVGLTRSIALQLAAQTIFGAAKMVIDTQEHPAQLRDMVTSPGGTTIAGTHVLEQRGVRGALMDAVIAATNRSRELGYK